MVLRRFHRLHICLPVRGRQIVRTLPDMIEELAKKNPTTGTDSDKALVVIDAGISSEDNLALIKEKGFHYLCVSRKNLTEYELAEDARTVTVLDSRKQPIKLTEVKSTANGDHYLLVNSPSKALTEDSMNRQYRQREDMLEAVRKGLSTKGGTKKYEKVCERVGRARGKYPSVQRFYDISYVLDDKKEKGEKSYWTEIVRIMSTQKLVRSKAANALGEIVEMDICTQPTQAATAIYDKLGFRHYPFRKMKICSAQT